MPEIIRSSTFSNWLLKLADSRARMRIQVRIDRMADGILVISKPSVRGSAKSELTMAPDIESFMQQGRQVVILLCGGDKNSQPRDIKQARLIAESWQEQNP